MPEKAYYIPNAISKTAEQDLLNHVSIPSYNKNSSKLGNTFFDKISVFGRNYLFSIYLILNNPNPTGLNRPSTGIIPLPGKGLKTEDPRNQQLKSK